MSDEVRPKRVSARKPEYKCRFLEIYSQHADFGGFSKDYFVVCFKRRGGVVALKDDRILLVKQYRFLTDGPSWELPGGTIEDGEDLEAGLQRECFEETGVRVSALKHLLAYYPGLDNVDNRTTIFYTDQVEVSGSFKPDPAEVYELGWFTVDESLDMVFRGEILDAMTVSGVLGFAHIVRQGR